MNKQKAIEQFLYPESKAVFIRSLPAVIGNADVIVFADLDGILVADYLNKNPQAISGIKRLIFQSSANQGAVRDWLKSNGFIIFGEELSKDDETFYETTAASPEEKALEEERAQFEKAMRAEIYIAGTYELFNEISLLLYENQNPIFPEFIFRKMQDTVQIIRKIDDIELYKKEITDDLVEKRKEARIRLNRLQAMHKTLYPYN